MTGPRKMHFTRPFCLVAVSTTLFALMMNLGCGNTDETELGASQKAIRITTETKTQLLGFRADVPINEHKGDSISLCPFVPPGLPAGLSYSLDVNGTASLRLALDTDMTFSYDKDAIVPGGTLPVNVTYTPIPGDGPNARVHIPLTFNVQGCIKDCILPDVCGSVTINCAFDAGPTDFVAPLTGDAPVTVPVTSCTVSLNIAGVINVGSAHIEGTITLAPVPVGGGLGIGGAAAAFRTSGPASAPVIPLLQWATNGETKTANLSLANPLPGAADIDLKLSPVFHWLATSGDLKLVINLGGTFHDVGIHDPSPITVFRGNFGPFYSSVGLDTQVSNAVTSAIGFDPGFGAAIAAGKIPVPLTDPELQQINLGGPPPTFGTVDFKFSTDVTPPVTSASLSPPPTGFGWNNSPVTVTLTSVDEPGGTGVNHISYSATGAQPIALTNAPGSSTAFLINIPGITTVTFFGTDNAANVEAARTVVVRIDVQPPDITIVQPAATTYAHSTTLTLNYTVTDSGGSGLDVVTVLLDGSPTLAGHGLASGQAINLLTELALGNHTFSITATDRAANLSTRSVTFQIIVTADSIKDDVTQFLAAGMIRNGGLANSLLATLDNAADQRARGRCDVAANVYRAFIHEVEAQSGNGIDATAANILIADAQFLIAHCP